MPKGKQGFQKGHKLFNPGCGFKKGMTPWNKDKKVPCLIGNTNGFKKGQLPWNKGLKGFVSGDKNGMWKGGRVSSGGGYILITATLHPNRLPNGYVLEHRLIMEKKIGRYLQRKEVVHHINGIKDDNRIENLKLFKNKSEHIKFHKLKENL